MRNAISVIDLDSLGMLSSSPQRSSAINFATWIALGLVAGFIDSRLLHKTDRTLVLVVLFSTVGAILGGFFSNLLGKPDVSGFDPYSQLVAVVGAVVFMIIYYALFRRRRFLSMR